MRLLLIVFVAFFVRANSETFPLPLTSTEASTRNSETITEIFPVVATTTVSTDAQVKNTSPTENASASDEVLNVANTATATAIAIAERESDSDNGSFDKSELSSSYASYGPAAELPPISYDRPVKVQQYGNDAGGYGGPLNFHSGCACVCPQQSYGQVTFCFFSNISFSLCTTSSKTIHTSFIGCLYCPSGSSCSLHASDCPGLSTFTTKSVHTSSICFLHYSDCSSIQCSCATKRYVKCSENAFSSNIFIKTIVIFPIFILLTENPPVYQPAIPYSPPKAYLPPVPAPKAFKYNAPPKEAYMYRMADDDDDELEDSIPNEAHSRSSYAPNPSYPQQQPPPVYAAPSYVPPQSTYVPSKTTHEVPKPFYVNPSPAISYSYPSSPPQVNCGENLLIGCSPTVTEAPCSAPYPY
ncbi:uncharacterized protein LOC129576534 [Sitodiplosis mosellana]|uniref:uncharacterized protein LOC129576534 n=1 Tax=Sitodiplosis mosellana TaxID=263140 RepID=UPI0024437F61|nr:uncharacterized protein LOC129576534 [Sitodiplosis mosellana]